MKIIKFLSKHKTTLVMTFVVFLTGLLLWSGANSFELFQTRNITPYKFVEAIMTMADLKFDLNLLERERVIRIPSVRKGDQRNLYWLDWALDRGRYASSLASCSRNSCSSALIGLDWHDRLSLENMVKALRSFEGSLSGYPVWIKRIFQLSTPSLLSSIPQKIERKMSPDSIIDMMFIEQEDIDEFFEEITSH